MAVTIRLSVVGKKQARSYRIVVTDGRNKRDGRYIETVGRYEPKKKPAGVTLKSDRIAYWLEKGARPSLTVAQLIRKQKRVVVAPPQG